MSRVARKPTGGGGSQETGGGGSQETGGGGSQDTGSTVNIFTLVRSVGVCIGERYNSDLPKLSS